MYTYALDGPVEMRDKPPAELGKDIARPRPEGSKYTVLSLSLSDCEITWCLGPGISTIFIKKNEPPYDLCVLSRRFST